jgi:hypothetical protein
MKRVLYLGYFLVLFSSTTTAFADGIVRVKCEEEDTGTQVYFNGKYAGECPGDLTAPDGVVQLYARKPVDETSEKVFHTQIHVTDGSAQRVELVMSAPQLTGKGKESVAATQLRAAQSGNVEAMKKMADYYDEGMGVEKSHAKAKAWRDKAEAATFQLLLRAANAGNVQAMESVATRYNTGLGVNRDDAKAKVWRNREAATVQARGEQKKAADKAARVAEVDFFEESGKLMRDANRHHNSVDVTTGLVTLPISLLSDLLKAPSKTTEVNNIKNEASLRPSRWGNPDSMIAKTSRQLKPNGGTSEEPQLVAAVK